MLHMAPANLLPTNATWLPAQAEDSSNPGTQAGRGCETGSREPRTYPGEVEVRGTGSELRPQPPTNVPLCQHIIKNFIATTTEHHTPSMEILCDHPGSTSAKPALPADHGIWREGSPSSHKKSITPFLQSHGCYSLYVS